MLGDLSQAQEGQSQAQEGHSQALGDLIQALGVLGGQIQALGDQMDRWTDRGTEGHNNGDPEKIALCGIMGQRPLWGRCPIDHYSKPNQRMGQRVPLTM